MSATLDRIAALLAKAERTDNEAEADAYLVKAQTLATLASIDLAAARARTARREGSHLPVSRTTSIGEKGRRANPHLISLYVAIAHSNDAKVDVATNSTYVVGYAIAEDLDAVEVMFSRLAVHMVQTGQAFVTGRSWAQESYWAVVSGRRLRREHTAQTARASFYRAYVARIGERLAQARREAVHAADESAARSLASSGGAELVLARKAAQVSDFHARTSGARGSWRGYSGSVRRSSGSAAVAGQRAASSARLVDHPELAGPRGAIAAQG